LIDVLISNDIPVYRWYVV